MKCVPSFDLCTEPSSQNSVNKPLLRGTLISVLTKTNMSEEYLIGKLGADFILTELSQSDPREVIEKFQRDNTLKPENDTY